MTKRFLLFAFISLYALLLSAQPCKEIIGYYPGWQWYDRAKLVRPATIDYSKYTILNYAFFKPNADGTIEGTDSWSDENVLQGQINWSTTPPSHYPNTSLVDLAHNNGVKVLISVGGWTLSDNFPGIAADATKRATFAHGCKSLVAFYNLDGIDIDWEYPGYAEHGGTAADKHNFTVLLQQIRDSLTVYGNSVNKTFLLSAALGAAASHMSFVEWSNVAPLLDNINLMSYDFFGSWDPITNHNSPLYAPAQGDPSFNINSAVTTLTTTYNVPANKIAVGVAFYGRSAKTTGAPALFGPQTGQVDLATFPEDEGIPLYYNILPRMNLFTTHFDTTAKSPYLTGNGSLNTFLSYDDPQSIGLKAQYVVNHNLRGAIIWEITGDYLETSPGSGIIAGTPLADTLNSVFCGNNVPPANLPPTVSITSPANNAGFTAPATFNIMTNASDPDGSIAKVQFYAGATLLGSDSVAPFNFHWAGVIAGSYNLTAKAYDNAGATTISAIVHITVTGNTPPSVSITSPLTGALFVQPATINIQATASDPDGTIARVRFYNGTTLLGQDLTAPYAYNWTNVAAGTYTLKAKAYDNSGATKLSTAVTVTVLPPGSNLPPVVSMTAPAEGSVFAAPATIAMQASASDPDGNIVRVRFYNGATYLGQDLTAPYAYNWTNVPAGTYSLKARAYDNTGAFTNSSIVHVTVINNVAPTVSITAPTNNATFAEPANLTIQANASDSDGSISKVAFFKNNILLGQDLSAPYSFAWNNVADGTYSLTAKAYDNTGAITTSAPVNITVTNTNACSAPATFYFDSTNYVPLGEIKLGQGQLYPVWGVSADAYIPSNRLNWAISMIHAAHLFRNVTGTDKIPANFYFATAAKESFCGCDPNMQTNPGQQFPFSYQAASVGDGCFQIENNSAYNEMIQMYPQRFPVGGHPWLIGGANYETAALSKAYYDIFTVKYWDVHHNWNPIGFFNTAADPNAAIRLMSVAYNRGLWYTQLGVVLSSDRANAIISGNIGPYFNDNSYGYDYQNALSSYCLVLNNQASQIDPSLLANNPATGQPYNYFGSYYNPNVSWSDFNAYIDSIAPMYPDINIANVKSAVQSVFNGINGGNPISFRYQLGQVLNKLLLLLPADDPTNNITTIYGCGSGNNNPPVCNVPGGLSVSGIAIHTATIQWTASGADGYNLQYRLASAPNWTTVNTGGTSYGLSGLDSCSSYVCRIQAVCGSNTSVYSAEVAFATTCQGGNNCGVPSGLAATPGNNVAALSWSNAGAASYNIQYRTSGNNSWTTVASNTNSYNLTGLAICTNYVFRVQSVCEGSSSAYSGEQAFVTTGCSNPDPPTTYCSSYSLNSTSEWVNSFSISNLTNNSGNNNGFGNFINMVATLNIGGSTSATFAAGIAGSPVTEYWKLWIDFNRDGDFEDAGEEVVSTTTIGSASFTTSLNVPANAVAGMARMRISVKRGSYPGVCDIYSGGEVEDYLVNMQNTLALRQGDGDHLASSAFEVYPNPGREAVTALFVMPVDAGVCVELVNAQGALLRQSCPGLLTAGPQRVLLNGLGVLPAGMYFVVWKQAGEVMGVRKWVKTGF